VQVEPPDDWRQHAQCIGSDPAAWDTSYYPEPPGQRAELARRVCRGCEVRQECAQWALSVPHIHGEYLTGVVVAGFAMHGNPSATRANEKIRRRMAARYDLPYSSASATVRRAAAKTYEQGQTDDHQGEPDQGPGAAEG
jgi:hypothetical protein